MADSSKGVDTEDDDGMAVAIGTKTAKDSVHIDGTVSVTKGLPIGVFHKERTRNKHNPRIRT
jgi:hypothetical protein